MSKNLKQNDGKAVDLTVEKTDGDVREIGDSAEEVRRVKAHKCKRFRNFEERIEKLEKNVQH